MGAGDELVMTGRSAGGFYAAGVEFCSGCGARLVAPAPTSCSSCGRGVFVDAKPSASAVIVEDGRFLAVRRARPPAEGGWDLPGGFCDADHPAVAAVREVKEETGLAVTLGPLVGLYMGTYEFDGRVVPTLNVYYLARLAGGVERSEPGEVSGIDWFELAAPPSLAFAHQGEMIADAAREAATWPAP